MISEIPAALRQWSEVSPGREAVVFDDLRLTWRQLQTRIEGNATAQLREGLQPGDRIAVIDRNHPALIETVVSCAAVGTTAVLPNINWTPEQIASVVSESGAKVALVGEEFSDALRSELSKLPAMRSQIVLGTGADQLANSDEYSAWLSDAQPIGSAADAEQCVAQAYSSGTTGKPKGVMIPHRAIVTCCKSSGAAITPHYDASSITLIALPMFHVAGLSAALIALVHGGKVIIRRGVVPTEMIDVMVAEKVSHASLVPAVYHSLLKEPDVATRDWSQLRMLGYGAAPMPPTLLRRCVTTWPHVGVNGGYGLTETAASVTILDAQSHRDHMTETTRLPAGKAVGDVEISIRDPDSGRPVPPHQTGEVWVRTDQLMLGYWNDHVSTKQAIDPDGWFHSGDIGRLDSAGHLYIVDRIKDIIISGGENIASVSVEEVLLEHPAVSEAAVIGVADEKWGETVKAVIVLAANNRFDEADLAQHCRDRLARFARPTSIEVVAELPRTASGKVMKGELRAQYR
jgi:acyl-CoA synthetase (AMP-forming)/AMP-acid ligase II